MIDEGRDVGIGAAIADSWEARAKAAKIRREYTGEHSIDDTFALSLIRAFANSTQDDVLDLRLAANVVVNRLDRAVEEAKQDRERQRAASLKRQAYDGEIDGRLIDVKRRAENLFARSKKVFRHSGRGYYGDRTDRKPEPFATIGSGTVRVATYGVKDSAACPGCSRRAKYALPQIVSWRNAAGDKDERGFVKSESEAELVGVCGQHGRDVMIGIAIAELVALDAIPSDHRYGTRSRGYGSGLTSIAGRDDTRLWDAWQQATTGVKP